MAADQDASEGALSSALAALRARVGDQRQDWFPDRGTSAYDLRVLSARPRCVLVGIYLDGESRPSALAKIRRDVPADSQPSPESGRPRLRSDVVSASDMTRFEYDGLRAIADTSPQAPGLGAIRPLDVLPGEATLVMTYVEAPTLRQLVLAESRLRSRPGRARPRDAAHGCELAGRWLRNFQREIPGHELPARQSTRAEIVAQFHSYADFLTASNASRGWGTIARHGAQLAERVLPEALPLAVGHGDFAPRNMFLDRGRLVVFDPMPRWRVPVYEDLSRFVVGLRLLGEQVHSHGWAFDAATMDHFESSAVDGYLGTDPECIAALRCYQLLITLDKWTALLSSGGRGWAGWTVHRSVLLAGRFALSEASRVVGLVEDATR